MLKGKKAVIFDMDGSLVDSMWIWPEVDRIYMDKYGLTQPADFHKAIEGKSYTETAQYFVDTFETLHRTVEQVKAEWKEMTMELYSTASAFYPRNMVIDQLLRYIACFSGKFCSHCRQYHPVFQFQPLDSYGGEKFFIHGFNLLFCL